MVNPLTDWGTTRGLKIAWGSVDVVAEVWDDFQARRRAGELHPEFDHEQLRWFLTRFRRQFVGDANRRAAGHALVAYVAWTAGNRQQALNEMKQAAADEPREQAWVRAIEALESPSKAERPAPTTGTSSGESPAL